MIGVVLFGLWNFVFEYINVLIYGYYLIMSDLNGDERFWIYNFKF